MDAANLSVGNSSPAPFAVLLRAWSKPSPDLPLLALLLLLAVIVRAPYLGDPAADYDEQLYSVIGQGWLNGKLPYVDMWDRKPPGLFALYALMHWIGGPSAWAYEIPGLICTILAGWLIYYLGRRLGTRFGALVASALFLFNIPLFILHMGQSETFLMPILLGQLIIAWRLFLTNDFTTAQKYIYILMVSGGFTLQIKYNVIPFCALFAIIATIRIIHFQKVSFSAVRTLAVCAILGILPTALFGAYFYFQGAFAEFFYANFVSIFERGEMPPQGIRRYWTHIIVAAFPLCVFALFGLAAARRNRQVDQTLLFLSAGFAVAGAASLIMLGHAFVHYFGPLLPFLCLIAIPFFSFHPSRTLFAGIAMMLAIVCASFPEQMLRSRSNREATAVLTDAINLNVPRAECLFVFDGPSVLYASTGRCIPSKIVFPDHFTNIRERNALGLDIVAEVRRVLETRPGAIVITDDLGDPRFNPDTVEPVRRVLASDYVMVDRTFLYPRHIELFLRADLANRNGILRPVLAPITQREL